MRSGLGFWMGRPGRREIKEVNWKTDWLLVILQAVVCVFVLFTDLTFIGAWIFILPPEWDWVIGMLLFVFIAMAAFVGDWLLIRFWGYLKVAKTWEAEGVGTKWDCYLWRLRQWPTWTGALVILLAILLFSYFFVWDWWWEYCLKTHDLLVPVPVVKGGSPWMTLGIFISLIGVVSFLLHPGKYPLTLSTFGGMVIAIAHWFYPVAIWIEYRRPVILYAVYACWCVAWVIGTSTMFFRFFLKEIPDPYTEFDGDDKNDSWKILEVINKLSGAGRPQIGDPQQR